MAAEKSAHKSVGRPFVKGGDPRQGRGPAKGAPNAGRPPDLFRELCRELACSAEDAARIALADSKHPAFIGALKWATEHGYGRPAQTIQHTGPDGGPVQVQIWKFGDKPVSF